MDHRLQDSNPRRHDEGVALAYVEPAARRPIKVQVLRLRGQAIEVIFVLSEPKSEGQSESPIRFEPTFRGICREIGRLKMPSL